ncbi:hypothetical protein DFH27DRAFT_642787 [Peziza echinospora]|nr:hypothetical protein DFH27DRAFT_642787 [Peziza echinospora]
MEQRRTPPSPWSSWHAAPPSGTPALARPLLPGRSLLPVACLCATRPCRQPRVEPGHRRVAPALQQAVQRQQQQQKQQLARSLASGPARPPVSGARARTTAAALPPSPSVETTHERTHARTHPSLLSLLPSTHTTSHHTHSSPSTPSAPSSLSLHPPPAKPKPPPVSRYLPPQPPRAAPSFRPRMAPQQQPAPPQRNRGNERDGREIDGSRVPSHFPSQGTTRETAFVSSRETRTTTPAADIHPHKSGKLCPTTRFQSLKKSRSWAEGE